MAKDMRPREQQALAQKRHGMPHPLPVDLIAHASELAFVPGQAYRISLALLVDYWLGGCQRLPDSTQEWLEAAQTHLATWHRYGRVIEAAVKAIAPRLEPYYRLAESGREKRRQGRLRMAARNAARKVGGRVVNAGYAPPNARDSRLGAEERQRFDREAVATARDSLKEGGPALLQDRPKR